MEGVFQKRQSHFHYSFPHLSSSTRRSSICCPLSPSRPSSASRLQLRPILDGQMLMPVPCELLCLLPVQRYLTPALLSYFQTNGFEGNQIVASYINLDGSLGPAATYSTGGKGLAGNNIGAPPGPHVSLRFSRRAKVDTLVTM